MRSIWSILALSLVITLAYGAPGQPKDITLSKDDPIITFCLNGVNNKYPLPDGDNSARKVKSVVSATSQEQRKNKVLTGVKYSVTIEVSYKRKTQICTAEILFQDWNLEPERTRFVEGPKCSK